MTNKQGYFSAIAIIIIIILLAIVGYLISAKKAVAPSDTNTTGQITEKIYHGTVEAYFEGTETLNYQFTYPSNFTVERIGNATNTIGITDTSNGNKAILHITYEGGRGFSPSDYWSEIAKQTCADCKKATSTPVVKGVGTNQYGGIVAYEGSAKKWVIWSGGDYKSFLFAFEMQKPSAQFEMMAQSFKAE